MYWWIPMAIGAAAGAINSSNKAKANAEQRDKEAKFRKAAITYSPWTGMQDPGMATPMSGDSLLGGALGGAALGASVGNLAGLSGGAGAGGSSTASMTPNQQNMFDNLQKMEGTQLPASNDMPMGARGSPGALGSSFGGQPQQEIAMGQQPQNMGQMMGLQNPYDMNQYKYSLMNQTMGRG